MTDPEALRRSVIGTYLALGKESPRAKIERHEGSWICLSAIRHPIGNFAIGFDGPGLPGILVNEAMARPHFRIYCLTGDQPDNLLSLAEASGLRERYTLSGMVLEKPTVDSCAVLEAQDLNTAQRVASFITNTFFWRSPRRSREIVAEIMAAAFPTHRYYFLEDDRGIVAAGTLTLDAEVIGLYNVCVRGDARSRGIGASFVAELSRRANATADHVALLCDHQLVPWYSRQGYCEVGSLRALSA